MRTLHTILIALALLVTSTVAAGPASACRCPEPALATAASGADAVFAGEVVTVEPRAGQSQRITVAVDAVWKGEVGARVVIVTPATSCGLVTKGAKVGRHLLFVVRASGGPNNFEGRQCQGTTLASPSLRTHADRVLGASRPPR
jgi:hypothetical protein